MIVYEAWDQINLIIAPLERTHAMRIRNCVASVLSLLAAMSVLLATVGSVSAQTDLLGESLNPVTGITTWALQSVDMGNNIFFWQILVLVEPDVPVDPIGHEHAGSFVLTVKSGGICYQQGALGGASPTAFATSSPSQDGCVPTPGKVADCQDADGCALTAGDVVYLPAGSRVVQQDPSFHAYGTPGSTVSALVLISQYVDEGSPGAAPCGGTCH